MQLGNASAMIMERINRPFHLCTGCTQLLKCLLSFNSWHAAAAPQIYLPEREREREREVQCFC